jgi:predicted MFS family arabinose efflux permease
MRFEHGPSPLKSLLLAEHLSLMARTVSERTIVLLIGAVQFVNILDFVMVMPLGPDLAAGLGVDPAHIGLIGGAYTAAAALSGFAGSFFLDRFDRRKALGVAMTGLVIGTAAGGFATGLKSLMAARILAGLFGGPATSLALSVIADVIPPERRGKAMGAVMGAFSVAQVLGVPAGLYLASHGGWYMPFFVVAGIGVLVAGGALSLLPPMTSHLHSARGPQPSLASLFSRPAILLSYAMTATTMMAGFIIIPNIANFVCFNLGLPRDDLKICYAVGGASTVLMLRIAGTFVDRYGSFRVGTVGSVFLAAVVYVGFVAIQPPAGVWLVSAVFVAFMTAMSFRNVSYNTLASKVPEPTERARFNSIQSMVQHLASAFGAVLSSMLLHTRPDQSLEGMTRVAYTSIAFSLALPLILRKVETLVLNRRIVAYAPSSAPAEH